MEIVPAIIAKSFEELEKKIKLVEPYVKWVQLDVMDGEFVPEKTWPYNNYHSELAHWHPELVLESRGKEFHNMLKQVCFGEMLKQVQHDSGLNLEAHLMIDEPEKEIGRWVISGARRILVHWEALKKFTANRKQLTEERIINILAKKCAKENVDFGIVLNLETSIAVLEKLLTINWCSFSVVQLMSIAKIGYYGQLFDERVIPKIRALRQLIPDVKIAVDGGINQETAHKVMKAGADILVVGSAIFKSKNIAKAIKELKNV